MSWVSFEFILDRLSRSFWCLSDRARPRLPAWCHPAQGSALTQTRQPPGSPNSRVITHVTLDDLHQRAQSFHLRQVWQLQQPVNLERRQKKKKKHVAQTDEWGHLKIWWQINKSSITRVQDEGPPRASCGGWPTVSDAQSHEAVALTHSATLIISSAKVKGGKVCQRRQRLMYRCFYLLSFQPLCQHLWDIKVINSRGERTQRPQLEAPEPKPPSLQPKSQLWLGSVIITAKRGESLGTVLKIYIYVSLSV